MLHVHPDGYGFVHPLVGDEDNVFVPPDEARKALDNDRVVVRIVPGNQGRTAGQIVKVVERRREFVVGIYTTRGDRAAVMPKDASLPGPISVPPTQLARDGDVVKVRLGIGAGILKGHQGMVGEVAGSLGAPGSPGAEVLNIAYAAGFSDEFPPEVMDEADGFELKVTPEEASEDGRRDLRLTPLVTVDGEDARDFDDAIFVEPKGHDWRLVVAIADVSHYVTEGSALNAEALHRATSVYLPDRVLPMLPERLSNGICSLRPDEDRLCMVSDMLLDRNGHLRSYELYPAVMRSHARCTYNEVQAVLDGKDVPHRNAFKPHFEKMQALARVLRHMREKRGAIDFDLPETKVELGDDGLPKRMVQRERLEAHRIVEECMLAANEAVAKFFQDLELPSVYRYHGDPDEEKLASFAALANAHGFELDPSQVTSGELNAFIKQLAGHPEQRALNQLLLRSMMQAVYSSQNVGHYGLAAEHYLHFTSPIRRYPDLLVHRLLKKHWSRGGKKPSLHELEREEEQLEEMAIQSSERERAAMGVEREVVSYYATLLMKDRVGEEFASTVTGVTDFGFFVQLDKEFVEGLVKAETLGVGGDYDPMLHALVFADGRKVRVGQKLTVRLISANIDRRQLDFEVVAFEGEEAIPSSRSLDSMLDRYRQRGGPRRGGDRGPRGRDGRHAQREQPPEFASAPRAQRPQAEFSSPQAQSSSPQAEASSPHPGFDRLRALAARKGGSFGQEAPRERGFGQREREGQERHRERPQGDRRHSEKATGRGEENPRAGKKGHGERGRDGQDGHTSRGHGRNTHGARGGSRGGGRGGGKGRRR